MHFSDPLGDGQAQTGRFHMAARGIGPVRPVEDMGISASEMPASLSRTCAVARLPAVFKPTLM
jgi:hypothetical protein